MNITRNVIIDLLPIYIAGEASADTRTLVDEYLQSDAELTRRLRSNELEMLAGRSLVAEKPGQELELKALRRTRGALGWQRRLYAWAIAFTLLPLSSVLYINQGHVNFHLLLRDYPWALGGSLSLAITCWINYFFIRRRLRGL